MPTTSTTSLYDSDDRVFYPFTTENAYINPYSSDRVGGELITEYNQRNALNTICMLSSLKRVLMLYLEMKLLLTKIQAE